MQDLDGKVAVITGGGSGIGFATAHKLAAAGMKLVLADLESEVLEAAVSGLAETGADVIGVEADVANLIDVEGIAERTWSEFGGAHLVFNNAGVAVSGPMAEMSHADWKWVIDVDLWGPIHGVEVFVPRMIEQRAGGHIVNTASFAGLVPNDELGVYCVAKYGVVGLSEVLRRELRQHEIGVSVLCPMRVATNIDGSGRNRQHEYGGPEAQQYDDVDEEQMAGRMIDVDEVADLVLRGIADNKLYLFPHPEARQFIARRFERIDRAFDTP
jgi:NAD(P)-dependent dehydrogenase (short-subunit alcohol dehydrogenase family)